MKSIDIVPISPYNIVEIVEGSKTGQVAKIGVAEVKVENKLQGKYVTFCKVLVPHAGAIVEANDVIVVWSTAVEEFDLPNDRGELYMIRDADIFGTVRFKE